ncbi:hypothetical protein C8J27_11245 [Rhodobacter aestuarii]|uniref:Uncharacterized protein n=1 Tax=Rhodobacter aestuarii TaxID=453582 RepID=A0A1N7Q930_9RHOB|nr:MULTISPECIES: hypothetical protein [Rhodobacter]PTV93765.1 hypothetical protein C8J27_11245 [Rhodobacter aestuarii]SIT19372.1 hypothetical protein SAMN05421580_11445 [Rhodobacter aestuarii]SOC08850.1 hypothetical protein SAMN05877809_104366 [Rhodobacter sp. JA431]
MSAHTPHITALASEHVSGEALTADALIAGPCALPTAPLAMPPQTIEHELGFFRRLLASLHPQAAPSPGPGL